MKGKALHAGNRGEGGTPGTLSRRLALEVEILPPRRIRTADHSHDVPRSVQRKRPRLALQLHIRELVQHLVSLAPVAVVAARDQVLPRRKAAARTGNDMVQRQLARRQDNAAVLARVSIAQQNVLAAQRTRLMGNPAVLEQTN